MLATYIVGFIVSRKSGLSTASSSFDNSVLRAGRPASRTSLTFLSADTRRTASFSPVVCATFACFASWLLDRVEVGERELGVDRLDVGHRIDLAGDVHDVRVLEAAHHVRDGVGLADVGEELVAEALAFRGAGHQPGDVDELDHRRHHLLRLRDLGDRLRRRSGTSTMPTFGSMVQNG